MSKRFTLPVEENEHGDYYITLPEEVLDDLGWQLGDNVEWSEDIDGSIILKRVEVEETL
ncbi:hypothetical protein SSZBM1_217 [Synechococcus phage S-SZBM1]|uniref:Uncharacterized protein n=1 Tax=Synechococcus phage S-SZBM1 TaxID=2926475 RepID=A0AC61TSY7_9CAUD|nr:hypothetical protein PP650_gp059 [Synechococcus phage S-SZBM1]UNH61334.1 hypothetical protein SSZBM1_217 [Synechococcus phage S-SZBM1]